MHLKEKLEGSITLKREEKNKMSREKIINSALQEFASKGYGLSSINTICSIGNISKGVMYHYYKDKDEIYLECIQECFDALTIYLKDYLEKEKDNRLQGYFDARIAFFDKYPLYKRLFCDAIISPPPHLASNIGLIKEEFDALNLSVFTELLKEVPLREDITKEQVIEVFRLFQDFLNARYQMVPFGDFDIRQHEEMASRSLNVLLYGVVERRENNEK